MGRRSLGLGNKGFVTGTHGMIYGFGDQGVGMISEIRCCGGLWERESKLGWFRV